MFAHDVHVSELRQASLPGEPKIQIHPVITADSVPRPDGRDPVAGQEAPRWPFLSWSKSSMWRSTPQLGPRGSPAGVDGLWPQVILGVCFLVLNTRGADGAEHLKTLGNQGRSKTRAGVLKAFGGEASLDVGPQGQPVPGVCLFRFVSFFKTFWTHRIIHINFVPGEGAL